MPEPLKILVILGSVREGRMAEPVGRWVCEQAAARDALACELVDLKAWDLPFYPFADAPAKGNYRDPLQRRWADKVAGADGYVLIAPEYNHGPPAVLKNALDFVYAEWNRKPVTFVGYGGNGGARSIEQLTAAARELQMAPLEASVHIMGVWGKVKDGVFAGDDKDLRWIAHLFDELAWWGNALRAGRQGPA
jgi:NAD(P)H-dependent FMN reductase